MGDRLRKLRVFDVFGVMANDTELFIGEPSSNDNWVRYIHNEAYRPPTKKKKTYVTFLPWRGSPINDANHANYAQIP